MSDPAVAEHAEKWAGEPVETGSQALAFAEIMREHTLSSTGGLTYAEMGQYQSAADPADPVGTNDEAEAAKDANGQPISNGARDIWITETALTTALNLGYMGEMLSIFSVVVGFALLLAGIGFVILSLAVFRGSTRRETAVPPAPVPRGGCRVVGDILEVASRSRVAARQLALPFVVPVKEVLVIQPVTRAARGRAGLLGVSLGLVFITLIVAASAAAHHNVIDFRQTCSGHRADGHNHSDTIYGSRICSDTPDIFRGLFGDDRIFGYRGDDTLLKGSKGDDFVSGGAGSDRIEGSDGVDTLDGGAAADRIEGGPDGDVIFGGPGHDRIFGQSGSDEIHGNPGADDIDCGDGNDEAWGGGGHDTFVECETIHQ